MSDRSPGVTLFVGLGRMGEPMVRRYASRRSTLVFDADPGTTTRVAHLSGAAPLRDLDNVPPAVDTVILMLPTSRVVESVLLGTEEADGLLERLSEGTLVIDMGSSEPASTRRMAQLATGRGLRYVDAPVSGGVSRAATGELAIMVGGTDEGRRAARHHLEPLGSSVLDVGPPGTGHAAKALNNLLSATNLAAAAEVLCVAQRAGIAPAVMVDVLNSSTGRSQATEVKLPRHVLTGSFSSGFEMDLMLKDLAIAGHLAEGGPVSTPITTTTIQTLTEARSYLDEQGLDHTELVRFYEGVNHALLRATATPDTERTQT